MPEMRYDLLREPLIRVRCTDGRDTTCSLPTVLALLADNDVLAFNGLQLHQYQAWHAFMVQLAAIALHRAAKNDPRQSEVAWRDMLLALTGNRAEPWCLVVEDLGAPAFMQPPVPEGSLAGFKNRTAYPDALDVLVTAKNHDVKANRLARPLPEHWLFTLISLQTMQGFLGQGNYGIARMNGGFASRPSVAYTSDVGLGARFRRDVGALLVGRAEIVREHEYATAGGKTLLWLEPWNGAEALELPGCDPYFIEICRRVRMTVESKGLVARTVSTISPRLAAKERLGNTGDPWTPIERSEGKALTLSASGFSYRLMQDLLFGGRFKEGIAQRLRPGDGDEMLFIASALVRGQGKTDGLHSRLLPIPTHVRALLGRTDDRQRLGALARRRVETAAVVQKKVLRPALLLLLQADPLRLNFDDERHHRWTDRFDDEVDTIFFERLWDDIDADVPEADRRWAVQMTDIAWLQLQNAIDSASLPIARHYRAIAAAERVFFGARHKHFPELRPPPTE